MDPRWRYPSGPPLSIVFIFALRLPWCRNLEAAPGTTPQLHADNLKCVSFCLLLGSPVSNLAWLVRRLLLGQHFSQGSCWLAGCLPVLVTLGWSSWMFGMYIVMWTSPIGCGPLLYAGELVVSCAVLPWCTLCLWIMEARSGFSA